MVGDPVSDGEAPTIDVGGAEPKDSFDDLLKRVVTGDHTPQLAPGTLLSERFKIEKLIGAGGMGAVYVARDQTLDRDVAIKLHHTPGGAFRLRREAIAMARLAHPNVVTVFEVGEVARFPYVVMEYVPGTTLRAWLSQQPRSVVEILEMLLAAGEGLAAAHEAGLLHRDIKPENVLIGSDGRARVGDFGLARGLDSKDEPPPSDSAPGHMAPMTQTGAVLGTPAYMAPEQLGGLAIDPRADQFAFCVTAWEALWSERPFRGASLDELIRAVSAGKPSEPPATPEVPSQLRAALERGLSHDPEARFPTMRALLDALRAPLRRRRKRVMLGAGAFGLAAIGVAGYLAVVRHASELSCDDAMADATRSLPREIASRLRDLGADDAAKRVAESLSSLAGDLEQSALHACQAEHAHEASPQLLAKSHMCREVAARTARDLLRPPRITLGDVPHLVLRANTAMPLIAPCNSVTFLSSSPVIPEDPVQLELLIDARTDLAIAMVELQSHHGTAAQVYLDRLDRSPLRESPLIKTSRMVAGALAAEIRGDMLSAEKLATDGYYASRMSEDDATLTTALAILLDIARERPPEDPIVVTWLRTATTDAERMAARTPWLAARLYLDAAGLADLTDDAPAALRYVERARKLDPTNKMVLAQAALTEGAVLMWSGHVPEAIAPYERGIALMTEQLGPDHPRVGMALADYSASLLQAGKLGEAMEPARQGIAILDKSADANDQFADNSRVNLAAALLANNQDEEARALLETARAHYVANVGTRTSFVANIDLNLAVIHSDDKDYAGAVRLLEDALATDEALLGKDRIEIADVLFNLAAARRSAGDLPGARTAAQRSAEIDQLKRPGVERHGLALAMLATLDNQQGNYASALAVTAQLLTFQLEGSQAIPWGQLERARALIQLGGLGRAAEARPLLVAARSGYAAVPLPDRVAEIDRLLAKIR